MPHQPQDPFQTADQTQNVLRMTAGANVCAPALPVTHVHTCARPHRSVSTPGPPGRLRCRRARASHAPTAPAVRRGGRQQESDKAGTLCCATQP
eukprot:126166-Chlamydomonas_euryale.AAC.2